MEDSYIIPTPPPPSPPPPPPTKRGMKRQRNVAHIFVTYSLTGGNSRSTDVHCNYTHGNTSWRAGVHLCTQIYAGLKWHLCIYVSTCVQTHSYMFILTYTQEHISVCWQTCTRTTHRCTSRSDPINHTGRFIHLYDQCLLQHTFYQ